MKDISTYIPISKAKSDLLDHSPAGERRRRGS